MKTDTLASLRSTEQRSTAYYYGDLERLRTQEKKNGRHENQNGGQETKKENDRQKSGEEVELSEYVEPATIADDVPNIDIPPLRDRILRQYSLPEYSTPEGGRKFPGETYSTAGTFPLREKEPLLAELEVVGRLPLTELDAGVRRSSSWYLCCPTVDEERDRETAWRCASWTPVTTPPVATQSTTERTDYVGLLKSERDSLSRALSAERARAQSAARAHDARLAELHAVIAELLRRGRGGEGIREESEEECESTTQPVEELDNDADLSRTEQNDTSSMLSAAEPAEQSRKTDDDDSKLRLSEATECGSGAEPTDHYQLCLNTAKCCQASRPHGTVSSCERAKGSDLEPPLHATDTGRTESRQAKLASRVRLRRTEDSSLDVRLNDQWCVEAAERLALDVCAQADVREALAAANLDGEALQSALALSRARCARLEADVRVLECALARAGDTAHRLTTSIAAHESSTVSLCLALKAADEALETYDVLLALTETERDRGEQREAAELVAKQLLSRLDAPPVQVGQPLLSRGPWLTHTHSADPAAPWTPECESRLRSHAARLKSETAALRVTEKPPELFTYHDIDPETGQGGAADMEATVMFQEVASAVERRAEISAKNRAQAHAHDAHERSSTRRKQHWLSRAASETDL